MTILSKMCTFGDEAEQTTIVEKIFHSLVPKFNFVVCAIEESKYIDELLMNFKVRHLFMRTSLNNQKSRNKCWKLLPILISTILEERVEVEEVGINKSETLARISKATMINFKAKKKEKSIWQISGRIMPPCRRDIIQFNKKS